MGRTEISALMGKTLARVEAEKGDDVAIFETDDGKRYRMWHDQDCCERVDIEDICGDLADLIGSPLTMAEEATSDDNPEGATPPEYQDSFTWTFYRFATAKGHVTIRWYGESNGYYSEKVIIDEIEPA